MRLFRKIIIVPGVTLLTAALLPADFSYQETSKVTGGLMAGMMKVAGVFSKEVREPVQATVAVKGDRMVRKSASHAQIIDLSHETITSVDMQKKTYSVMTFAQMKQLMEEMSQKLQESKKKNEAQMDFKVSANATGNTKTISGFDAREMVVKINMEATDQKSGQKGAMIVTTHVWIAANIPGYGELRDFQRRMAEKLAWTPGSNAFMANPDVSKGLAEASKEISKLDGAPVLQIISMGPEGSAPPDGATAPAAQQQQSKPSVGGALGSALGGRFGLGKKKNAEQQEAQNSGNAQAPGSLIDMTTESSNFSTGGVEGAIFEIPAGFKEVKPDLKRK